MKKLLLVCLFPTLLLSQTAIYRVVWSNGIAGQAITGVGQDGTITTGWLSPSTRATIDLTAQSATLTTQTLYTPTADGMYRVSAWASRTRAATTSSTLGSLTITWTDVDMNTSFTYTVAMHTSAGAVATTNGNNLTTVTGSCEWIPLTIYAKSGVAITYTLTYASSGGTTMQYALRMKCEAL